MKTAVFMKKCLFTHALQYGQRHHQSLCMLKSTNVSYFLALDDVVCLILQTGVPVVPIARAKDLPRASLNVTVCFMWKRTWSRPTMDHNFVLRSAKRFIARAHNLQLFSCFKAIGKKLTTLKTNSVGRWPPWVRTCHFHHQCWPEQAARAGGGGGDFMGSSEFGKLQVSDTKLGTQIHIVKAFSTPC